MKRFVLFYLLLLSPIILCGQQLYSLNTLWDDDFRQWEIYFNEGELKGSIEMRYRTRNDFSQWDFRLDGYSASFRQFWDNNPNRWEYRSPNGTIDISTVWSNDFRSFRVTDGRNTITLERIHYNDDPIEWAIRDDKNGAFYWYNEFELDYRDWVIVDELQETISLDMKVAAVFISILFSNN